MMVHKVHISSIPQFHKVAGLPQSPYRSLSIVKFEDLNWRPEHVKTSVIRDFYIIALKRDVNTRLKYGQQDMDVKRAFLHFMAPKQVLTIEKPAEVITNNGWLLLIHRDFLWNTSLLKNLRQHECFSYTYNQVINLDCNQEETIDNIFRQIDKEQHLLTGTNTREVLISLIGLLLAYAERYLQIQRQFKTGRQSNDILARLNTLIDEYLVEPNLTSKGVPTIAVLSDKLNVSPNHLSRLVRSLTGQSTQHILQDKLIRIAEEKLSTTSLAISEIAYQLGFKSPQSFSRLFKVKTRQSPTEFRKAF